MAQSHSLTANSLQLDDSTVPLSDCQQIQLDDSTVPLSDRLEPSAWRWHSPTLWPSTAFQLDDGTLWPSTAFSLTIATPSHAYSAGHNSVSDLLLASDPALLVSAPALALVAGATKLSKMAAQCFLFHSFVPFMPHCKTQINTTDTSCPPSVSRIISLPLACRLFDTRLITVRGLAINQGHVGRDRRGPPVFQTIPPPPPPPPLSPISHFKWPALQGWAKGFSFLIN